MENTETPEEQPNPEEKNDAVTNGEQASKEEHKSKIELAKWQLERAFITEQQYNDIVNEHRNKIEKLPE